MLDPGHLGLDALHEAVDRGNLLGLEALGLRPVLKPQVRIARGEHRAAVHDRLHPHASVDPGQHRVVAQHPLDQRLLTAFRDGEIALPDQTRRTMDRPCQQEIGFFGGDPFADALDPLRDRDCSGEGDHQQAALHATVHAALEAGQGVRGKEVLCHRPELGPAFVNIAPLDWIAGHNSLEGVRRDGFGRQLVGCVQKLADQAEDMLLVPHLRGRNGADCAGGQEAAGEIEKLTLAVLGGPAMQHDSAGL